MKNSLGKANNRMERTEERISECEERTMEMSKYEQQREEIERKKNEPSLRDLCDNNKTSNIRITRVEGISKGERGGS